MTNQQKIFQNLIWPAAAGNVAWAFFTVAIKEDITCSVLATMISLLLIAAYLAADWAVTASMNYPPKLKTSFFDALLAVAIVVFAIATQEKEKAALAEEWLGIVFLVAIGGHLSGAWMVREDEGLKKWIKRFGLAGINAPGLVMVLLGYFHFLSWTWTQPVALGMVVGLWFWFWPYSDHKSAAST
jgi:hypothetical protein